MIEEKAKEIVDECVEAWKKRGQKIDPGFPDYLMEVLRGSPHDDGLMRVTMIGDKGTRLVPMKDIILHGLQGTDLEKYPLENET
jgi:hypothetical protein